MNNFKVWIYISVTIVAAMLVCYGINVFPTPGTDSRVFIPAALLYSKGYGLTNPLYDVAYVLGDLGKNFKFNYYVPFFPLLLGTLSKVHPGVKTIFIICSLISATGLLLYGRALALLLPQRAGTLLKAAILCSVTYASIYLLPTVGRPENLTCLLVLLVYMLYRKKSTINALLYNVLICLLFAIIMSSQLICFYFCFLFFVSFEVLNAGNIYNTVWVNTLRFAVVMLLFAGILYCSPNGLMETVNGIKMHGSWALTRSDRSVHLFFHYWLLAPLNFGFLIIFLLCAIFYVRMLWVRCRQLPAIPVILVLLLQLMIVYGFCKFVLYAAPTVYNATQFILPLLVNLIANIIQADHKTVRTATLGIAQLTYIAGSVLFLRWALLFIDYKQSGRDYDTAKTLANRIMHDNKTVYITAALWPLFDNAYDAKFVDTDTLRKGDIYLVQQVYLPNAGFYLGRGTVINDWGIKQQRKVLGIPLSNTPQAYSFLVCRAK